VPAHAYSDYTQAARECHLALTDQPDGASLAWACEPASPLCGAQGRWPQWLVDDSQDEGAPDRLSDGAPVSTPAPLVLDCAYAPLRVSVARPP
jgi:histidinol-phosphate aminotransferase